MRFHFNAQVAAGVIVGILGILFTLQNFSVLLLGDAQRFWPLLVVAFGLCRVFERSGRVEGFILLIVGVGVQLSNLTRAMIEGFAIASLGMWLQFSYFGIVHVSSYRPWPLVLVAIGAVMVWRGFYARGFR